MTKETYTVSWSMQEERIIKLTEADKTYDISDAVHKYLDSKGLYDSLDDKKVVVEIDESKGENGTIVRLELIDSKNTEPKKEEKKEVVKKEINGIVKEMTVAGVSVNNKGVTFKEEEKVWYTLSDDIDPKKFKDEYTKKIVEVVIEKTEKGNDIVKSFTMKAVEEPKEEKADEPKMNNKDAFYRIKQLENQVRYLREEKSNSFEAQASVTSANQTVSGMVDNDSNPEEVLRMIEKISETNFDLIQKLKQKNQKDEE